MEQKRVGGRPPEKTHLVYVSEFDNEKQRYIWNGLKEWRVYGRHRSRPTIKNEIIPITKLNEVQKTWQI